MGESKVCEAILELGTRLVAELDGPARSSITAKWMSWHLAELITAAETDSAKSSECRDLILKLWRARRFFPSGDPFDRYEAVLVAVENAFDREPRRSGVGWFDARRQEADREDLALLVKEIRRSVHLLALAALQIAVETEGLEHDKLLELAEGIEADAQTRVLVFARTIAEEMRTPSDLKPTVGQIGEVLDRLQHRIEEYRQVYEKLTERGE